MRKTLTLIFGIIILQLSFSCKSQYSTTELKNNFTTEQISDLNKITEFFKNQMCLGMESDFKTCYERTPHEYLEATGSGFWNNIDFDKQKELYNEISESTFDEIWAFCKSIYPESGTELKSLCPVNGKYISYLIELGKTNTAIAKYADRVSAAGDFNELYLNYSNILNNKKDFNLNDPNVQLILAIHYLSINDDFKRTDKWEAE
ncbi:hypothetical protein ACFS5M_12710 [Lacinutrix iliipiscaria]|uniref:Uncharacterized protein n=1 Tax=Lacinutrix iliipiscaria TaxID=1230532 RepID=A0ABW5WQG8_9FLAO